MKEIEQWQTIYHAFGYQEAVVGLAVYTIKALVAMRFQASEIDEHQPF